MRKLHYISELEIKKGRIARNTTARSTDESEDSMRAVNELKPIMNRWVRAYLQDGNLLDWSGTLTIRTTYSSRLNEFNLRFRPHGFIGQASSTGSSEE
jgi:hypothetical protein